MPFYGRALGEEALSEWEPASADLSTAEEVHRKAILDLPDMKERYGKYLRSILKQHATLLDQLGRTGDAEKLRLEAASL